MNIFCIAEKSRSFAATSGLPVSDLTAHSEEVVHSLFTAYTFIHSQVALY